MFIRASVTNPQSAIETKIALSQRIMRGMKLLSACVSPGRSTAPHLATGLRGEEEAFFYLRRHGYVVVARRWNTPKLPGDIDLIAWDGDILCFIEVKTRTGRPIVPAEFAVDLQKRQRLCTLAAIYRKRMPKDRRRPTPFRFDVVAVYLPAIGTDRAVGIEIFPSAFGCHAD